MGKPGLLLLGRWMRWLVIAALFAYFLRIFGLSSRPDWVHFSTGLALWFMLETGYNWLAIQALNRSDLPLFPTFQENSDGDEWPADRTALELKDWLKSTGFKRCGALKAELFEATFLRASIYESSDGLTRIQILFLPKRQGVASTTYTISTVGYGGERLITDNQFLPYGGYYPENWLLARKPLIGCLRRLLALHQRRVMQCSFQPVESENSALEDLNEQQRILEKHNTDAGFLVPRSEREEKGRISPEGRYRLWKEMWWLAYFGHSVSGSRS